MSRVSVAGKWARRLVEGEAKRSGTDINLAIKSVARKLRQPPGSVWALLFRAPKRLTLDLFEALEAAVEHEIRREIAALESELEAHRARRRGLDGDALEEVEAGIARLREVLNRNN